MRILLSALGSAGVNSAIKSVAASLGKGGLTGAILGTGVAVAGLAVGLGVQAVKAAGDFQQELTQLVTGAGEVHSNLKMVGDGILKLAVDTGTSTKQLVDGMYMIESAGYHGAAGLNVLKVAAQGARVGNADLGDVANALTTILTDYHLSANQATAAMNALTTTVASGKTHLQDLAKSMGAVLPLASSLGISFPQVAGAMAVMTNAGKNARVSAQNLANTLRSLAAPNATAVKAMKSVGLSAQQLKDILSQQGLAGAIQVIEQHVGKTFPAGSVAATDAFKKILGGATGYNVALMLGGKNMAAFQANVAAISKAMQSGASDVQGWSDVQSDLNFQWDRAVQLLTTTGIKIGTTFLPVVTKVVAFFSDNFPKVLDLFSSTSGAAQKFGGALTGILPIARIFTDFVKGQLYKDLETAGIAIQQVSFWIDMTLKPALKAALPAFENLGTIMITRVLPAFLSIWAAGQNLTRRLLPILIDVVEHAIPPIIRFASIIADGLGHAISFLAPYIVAAVQAIDQFAGDIATRVAPIVNAWFDQLNQGLQAFQQLWNMVWPSLEPIVKFLFDTVVEDIRAAWIIVTSLTKIALDLLSANFGQAGQDIQDAMTQMSDLASGKASAMSNSVSNSARSMSAQVQQSLSDMSNGGLDSMQTLSSRGSQLFDFFKANGVKDMSQLDASTIAYVNDMAAYLDKADARRAQSAANAAGKAAVQGGVSSNIVNKNFASGIENFSGGLAYVHRGEVLANLAPGTSVVPANRVQILQHGGGGAPTHMTTNIFSINVNTMARNQMEVSRMVDLFEQELARRFHVQTAGYSSGGVY